MKDRDGDIIHAPAEKRLILDFYKNNSIHFFLIPSLVAHALRRGVPRSEMREAVWWWLDLFRWEFALPEREAVTAEIEDTLAYFAARGAIDGEHVNPAHVLLVFGDGILDSFREAYWIVAKTLLDLDADGFTYKAAIARMQKSFIMHQLLGQIRRPEGNSAVTFANALNRFAEIGCIALARRGRGGRERVVLPGPASGDLAVLERRLADSRRLEGVGRLAFPIPTELAPSASLVAG
jgi:glycerol-3-phosphate O-acyltransferase